MTSVVREVVSTCEACQTEKAVFKLQSTLRPLPVVGLWERVQVDLVGPCITTPRGFSYLAICVDSLSRWVEAAPLRDCTSATVARFFQDYVLAAHGDPVMVMTDNASYFKYREFAQLCREHGVRQIFSSPGRPSVNGMVEKHCHLVVSHLRKMVDERASDWDLHLSSVLRGLRFTVQSSTRYSPYSMLTGREPRLGTVADLDHLEAVEEYMQDKTTAVAAITACATNNSLDAQEKQKAAYHRKRPQDAAARPAPDAFVLIKRRGRGHKLTAKAEGPYRVVSYAQDRAIIEDADGQRWTEPIAFICPYQSAAPAGVGEEATHKEGAAGHKRKWEDTGDGREMDEHQQ
jgi:hypothetical protein